MGKSQREKGKRWERAVANALREVFPDADIRRGRQAEGAAEADVICPVIWPECHHGAVPRWRPKLEQAQRDSAGSGLLPVVFLKVDRLEPVCVLTMADFLAILGDLVRCVDGSPSEAVKGLQWT